MSKKDPGKEAEQAVQKWLDQRSQRDITFAWHRYPDARSARGALAAQPSDFLVSQALPIGAAVTHLEVKETMQKTRLPKSKIGQYGQLLKFDKAGINAVVLVHRRAIGDWYIFWNGDLFDHDEPPASFPFNRPESAWPTAADALTRIFK